MRALVCAAVVLLAAFIAVWWLRADTPSRSPGSGVRSATEEGVDPKPPEHMIRLVVRSHPGGAPVSGARCVLRGRRRGAWGRLGEGTTDARGRVRLRSAVRRGLSLEVRGVGHVGLRRDYAALPSEAEIDLRRVARLEATVVDRQGRPVEGAARLTLGPDGRRLLGLLWPEERPPGESMALPLRKGGVRVSGLPPGRRNLLEITAPGFTSDRRWITLVPGGAETIRIRLQPAGNLAGMVTAASGRPLGGAEVRVFEERGGGFRQVAWTRSDGGGRFLLRGLPGGERVLQVQHRSGRTLTFAAARVQVVPDRTVDLRPVRAGSEELTVAVAAAPLAPADLRGPATVSFFVVARSDSPVPFASIAETLALGSEIDLVGLPPGLLHLSASVEDPRALAASKEVEIRKGADRRRVVLQIQPDTILGRVVVRLPPLQETATRHVALLAGGDVRGRYENLDPQSLEVGFGVRRGDSCIVLVMEGRRVARLEVKAVEKETRVSIRERDFVLGATLRGRVRRAGTDVRVLLLVPGTRLPIVSYIRSVPLDNDGRFVIRGAPPDGVFVLAATSDAIQVGPRLEVRTPASGHEDDALVLDPPP